MVRADWHANAEVSTYHRGAGTLAAAKHNYNIFSRDYWIGRIDSRPLSVFRVLFALILLKMAVYHFPVTSVFYTDNGLFSRTVLLSIERLERFSFMDALSQVWVVHAIFL